MTSTTNSTETILVTGDARGCPICGSAEFAPVCEQHGFGDTMAVWLIKRES
jgi:hypothetical protein